MGASDLPIFALHKKKADPTCQGDQKSLVKYDVFFCKATVSESQATYSGPGEKPRVRNFWWTHDGSWWISVWLTMTCDMSWKCLLFERLYPTHFFWMSSVTLPSKRFKMYKGFSCWRLGKYVAGGIDCVDLWYLMIMYICIEWIMMRHDSWLHFWNLSHCRRSDGWYQLTFKHCRCSNDLPLWDVYIYIHIFRYIVLISYHVHP